MPPLEAVSHTTHRTDVWAVSHGHCRAHYQILAEAEPDLLCRVLNHFALQSLAPLQLSAAQEDGLMHIEARFDELSWHRAEVIAQKLRNLISVHSVDLRPIDEVYAQHTQAAG